MPSLILTSSFQHVAKELFDKGMLPKKPVRVAFVLTAGEVYETTPWRDADRKALMDLGYSVFDVDFKGMDQEQLKPALEPAQIIFVAGGNTTYLFEHAHASGFSRMIRELLAGGRLYIGSSAGSILAGPTVEPFMEDDLPELPKGFVLRNSKGLGLVDDVILPHYPEEAAANDVIAKKFADRFTFVKLKDEEYRVEDL